MIRLNLSGCRPESSACAKERHRGRRRFIVPARARAAARIYEDHNPPIGVLLQHLVHQNAHLATYAFLSICVE